jgi:hypothetical protein
MFVHLQEVTEIVVSFKWFDLDCKKKQSSWIKNTLKQFNMPHT